MSTPQELFKHYIEEVCFKCTQEDECDIRIYEKDKSISVKCLNYKKAEYCMQHKCNGCKNEQKCFGGGNNGERQYR